MWGFVAIVLAAIGGFVAALIAAWMFDREQYETRGIDADARHETGWWW